MLKRTARIASAILFFIFVIYLTDAVILRIRRDPTSSVTVHPWYAVPHKDNRVEIMPADPYSETCVNSLLPHQQKTPCWYLRRHSEKKISL